MTDIYDRFEKWLTEFQEDGYRAISKNAPSEIKEEAKKADDVYYNRTGRHLFHIDNEWGDRMNKLIDQANRKALEYFRCHTDGKGLDHNALAFAIQALEKQVPKKVKEAHFETVCPVCKGSLYIDDLNVVEQSRYCPDCGQMLEWE